MTAQNTQQGQHACTRAEPWLSVSFAGRRAFTAQHFCLPHKRPCACCWSEISKTLRVVGACHWRPENTVTMNAEEGWAKPYTVVWDFSPIHPGSWNRSRYKQRVKYDCPRSILSVFSPYQFPLILSQKT